MNRRRLRNSWLGRRGSPCFSLGGGIASPSRSRAQPPAAILDPCRPERNGEDSSPCNEGQNDDLPRHRARPCERRAGECARERQGKDQVAAGGALTGLAATTHVHDVFLRPRCIRDTAPRSSKGAAAVPTPRSVRRCRHGSCTRASTRDDWHRQLADCPSRRHQREARLMAPCFLHESRGDRG